MLDGRHVVLGLYVDYICVSPWLPRQYLDRKPLNLPRISRRVYCHAPQGVVGSMPWVALGFNTLYLQLLGFSDMKAAILRALFLLGVSLGSFGGGYIGEAAYPWQDRQVFQPAYSFGSAESNY